LFEFVNRQAQYIETLEEEIQKLKDELLNAADGRMYSNKRQR
jgi:hypothetical protein